MWNIVHGYINIALEKRVEHPKQNKDFFGNYNQNGVYLKAAYLKIYWRHDNYQDALVD